MHAFEVEQDIAAPAEKVWVILTDAQRLVGADLGVTRIEGTIGARSFFKLWAETAPGRAFALRVGAFEPPGRMTWEGGMPFGLLKAVRTFTLTPNAGGVRLHMREVFSGAMAGMVVGAMPDLTPSFRKFALGVKALAEAS
jgi:hypothetical protein